MLEVSTTEQIRLRSECKRLQTAAKAASAARATAADTVAAHEARAAELERRAAQLERELAQACAVSRQAPPARGHSAGTQTADEVPARTGSADDALLDSVKVMLNLSEREFAGLMDPDG